MKREEFVSVGLYLAGHRFVIGWPSADYWREDGVGDEINVLFSLF